MRKKYRRKPLIVYKMRLDLFSRTDWSKLSPQENARLRQQKCRAIRKLAGLDTVDAAVSPSSHGQELPKRQVGSR